MESGSGKGERAQQPRIQLYTLTWQPTRHDEIGNSMNQRQASIR